MSVKNQSAQYYRENRNTTREKAISDISLGKKGEFFAAHCLRNNYGFPFIEPDLSVRNGNSKGWDADLPFKSINNILPNIHVKTCNKKTYDFCDDYSWTFQLSDNIGKFGKDEIFNKNDDEIIVFVYAEDDKIKQAGIKAILPWGIVKTLLRDPVKSNLKNIKKCLYYQDFFEKLHVLCL